MTAVVDRAAAPAARDAAPAARDAAPAAAAAAAPLLVEHHTRSLTSRLAAWLAWLFLRPVVAHWPLTHRGIRLLPCIDGAFRLLPKPRYVTTRRVRSAGVRGELVAPCVTDAAGRGALLYLHGGAFVLCGLSTHRRVVARLAQRTGRPVLSVAYRQLPKADLAGSRADCLAAYRWLLGQGYAASQIVLAGDSAGGHLAFTAALDAAQAGLPCPAGIVAISPWLDFDDEARLGHPGVRRDILPVGRFATIATLCAGRSGTIDPVLSPVNAALADLPPTLIQASRDEVLSCDATLMAGRLAEAGNDCTLSLWAGQVHAFPVLAHALPEGKAALAEMAEFVGRVTAAPVALRPHRDPSRRNASR